MAKPVGKTARQKELEKLYNKMCGRYSRYEVWQDMVWMVATAISNAVDKRYFDQREANYMRIVQKYSEDEIRVFPDFFTHIVLGMEENPDCDFLGELYMDLELGNKHAGQFFTPYSVCQLMAECSIDDVYLKKQLEKDGWISVNDCACGAGATLVAAANHFRKIGINYQMQALFVAQDVDATVALMCYIQLSLLGCAGYVVIGNTLTEPQVGPVLYGEDSARCWFTPMYFHNVWSTRRAIDQVRRMFGTVATARPEAAEQQAKANMADAESAGKPIPEAIIEQPAVKAIEPEPEQPTFVIRKNGQLSMF